MEAQTRRATGPGSPSAGREDGSRCSRSSWRPGLRASLSDQAGVRRSLHGRDTQGLPGPGVLGVGACALLFVCFDFEAETLPH